MKKGLILILCATLMFSIAYGEGIDYKSMTYDELLNIQQSVQNELLSRPESVFTLEAGTYIIGKDIMPGTYYALMTKPRQGYVDTEIWIFPNAAESEKNIVDAKYESVRFTFGSDSKQVVFKKDNVINVRYATVTLSALPLKFSDYYTYELPEGTYVPIGLYDVDEDIPAGKYIAYSGTINGGSFAVKDGDDSEWYEIPIKQESVAIPFVLESGNSLIVEKDIVLKKQASLSFD